MSVLDKLEYVGRRDSLAFLEKKIGERFSVCQYLTVIETGTTRKPLDGELKGDGGSTLFFAEFLKQWPKGGTIHTVDIDEENINNCKFVTKEYDNIAYHTKCSVEFLREYPQNYSKGVDVLYLDSYDSNPATQREASGHQIQEAYMAMPLLHMYSLILLDDVGINFRGGKGDQSVPFLLGCGWKILNHSHESNQLLFSRV